MKYKGSLYTKGFIDTSQFVGMDGKNYVATINTSGESIAEPTLAS